MGQVGRFQRGGDWTGDRQAFGGCCRLPREYRRPRAAQSEPGQPTSCPTIDRAASVHGFLLSSARQGRFNQQNRFRQTSSGSCPFGSIIGEILVSLEDRRSRTSRENRAGTTNRVVS